MKLILKGKGLRQIVTATEKEPAEATNKDRYLQRKDQALKKILLAIDDRFIDPIINIKEPSEVWEKLKDTYESVSKAHLDAYIAQLQVIRMKSTEKIMDLVNLIKTLENKLESIGHIVEPDETRRILLRGVREENSIYVQVIRSSGLSFNKAGSGLITFEAEAQVKEGIDNDDRGTTALRIKYDKACEICGPSVPEGVTPHTTESCFFNPKGKNFRYHLVKKLSSKNKS